jgi:hypothetical protein
MRRDNLTGLEIKLSERGKSAGEIRLPGKMIHKKTA